ncbi:MAG: hypothetical protein NWF01_11110 [Candidatus Bathyarchaeota archaeon]|nr:hypothetical protein [Candidatus Bathyarchaeota archaeon]
MNIDNSINDEENFDWKELLFEDLEDESSEEEETNLTEIFTPEEIEEYFYSNKKPTPFSELSNSLKGVPLEQVIRRYCTSNKLKYNMLFTDLARNKNRKGAKGKKDVDFVINNYAAIESKNWDCFGGTQYTISPRDMNNQVLNKFNNYANLKKILIIANPWWNRDTIKYLINNKVEIIEVGFQVTFDTTLMETAFWKIKPQLDTLLYIPYQQLHRIVFTI